MWSLEGVNASNSGIGDTPRRLAKSQHRTYVRSNGIFPQSVTMAIDNRDHGSPEYLVADRSNSTDFHLGLWTLVIPTMGNNYSWL